MLGSPASPRKRPFELLSDLVDDGGFGEDLHPERWDVSALDEMARFTKLGLGVGGELLACSEEAVLMGRWGRSCQEEQESTPGHTQEVQAAAAQRGGGCSSVPTTTEVQLGGVGREPAGVEGEGLQACRVEVYQVAAEEEQEAAAAAGAAPEPCNEHNYSLSQGGEEEQRPPGQGSAEEVQGKGHLSQDQDKAQEEEDDDEEEEDGEDGAEETVAEAELSSSSETECGEFPPLVREEGRSRRGGGGGRREMRTRRGRAKPLLSSASRWTSVQICGSSGLQKVQEQGGSRLELVGG